MFLEFQGAVPVEAEKGVDFFLLLLFPVVGVPATSSSPHLPESLALVDME